MLASQHYLKCLVLKATVKQGMSKHQKTGGKDTEGCVQVKFFSKCDIKSIGTLT